MVAAMCLRVPACRKLVRWELRAGLADPRVAPLRRSRGGAITPIRKWRLYGDHTVAPIRRSWNGAIGAVSDTLNGLFQAAKRKARGYRRLSTIRTVIFLIAGKLDFRALNPHTA